MVIRNFTEIRKSTKNKVNNPSWKRSRLSKISMHFRAVKNFRPPFFFGKYKRKYSNLIIHYQIKHERLKKHL